MRLGLFVYLKAKQKWLRSSFFKPANVLIHKINLEYVTTRLEWRGELDLEPHCLTWWNGVRQHRISMEFIDDFAVRIDNPDTRHHYSAAHRLAIKP